MPTLTAEKPFKSTRITIIDLVNNAEATLACDVNEQGIVKFPLAADLDRIQGDNLLAEFPDTALPIFYIGKQDDGTVQLSLPVTVAQLHALPQNAEEICGVELAALKAFVSQPSLHRRPRQ